MGQFNREVSEQEIYPPPEPREKSFDVILYEYQHQDGPALNDLQVEAAVALIGHRCRQTTKDRLHRKLSHGLGAIKRVGIFTRLSFTEDDCDYCPGQSYPDEIRTVRECLLL